MKKLFQNIAALFLITAVSLSVAGFNITAHECGETGEKNLSLQLTGHVNHGHSGDDCLHCAAEEESCCEMEDMQQEKEGCCDDGSSGDFAVEFEKDDCCIEYSNYFANHFDIKLTDENNSNHNSLKIIREEKSSAFPDDFTNHIKSPQRPLRLPYGDTYLHFIGVMLS